MQQDRYKPSPETQPPTSNLTAKAVLVLGDKGDNNLVLPSLVGIAENAIERVDKANVKLKDAEGLAESLFYFGKVATNALVVAPLVAPTWVRDAVHVSRFKRRLAKEKPSMVRIKNPNAKIIRRIQVRGGPTKAAARIIQEAKAAGTLQN